MFWSFEPCSIGLLPTTNETYVFIISVTRFIQSKISWWNEKAFSPASTQLQSPTIAWKINTLIPCDEIQCLTVFVTLDAWHVWQNNKVERHSGLHISGGWSLLWELFNAEEAFNHDYQGSRSAESLLRLLNPESSVAPFTTLFRSSNFCDIEHQTSVIPLTGRLIRNWACKEIRRGHTIRWIWKSLPLHFLVYSLSDLPIINTCVSAVYQTLLLVNTFNGIQWGWSEELF